MGLLALLVLVSLLVLFIVLLTNETASKIPVLVEKNPGLVELHLISPLENARPSSKCATKPCERLLELITNAENTIDFAIYGMRDQPEVLDALKVAQARGIKVRGIVDRQLDGSSIYSSTDKWVDVLGKNNVRDDFNSETKISEELQIPERRCPARLRPENTKGPLQCPIYDLEKQWLAGSFAAIEDFPSNRIMHNKFVIIDKLWVWTGSANISNTGTGGYNANAVVIIYDLDVAGAYTNEFEQMWVGSFHEAKCLEMKCPIGINPLHFDIGSISLQLWFSPQNRPMQYAIRPFITAAEKSLNIAAFFLTDKWVTADIIAAHQRGIDVRIIVDATSAQNAYSKHQILREAGVPVKVENWGGKMHMKVASVDGEHLVVGSMNWTSAGNYSNDENTFVIQSDRLAPQFDNYFNQLWKSIPEQWAYKDPLPESLHSPDACTDGIDNDFDELKDSDPECKVAPLPETNNKYIRSWPKSKGRPPNFKDYQNIWSLQVVAKNTKELFEGCVSARDRNHKELEALIRDQLNNPDSMSAHGTYYNPYDRVRDGQITIWLNYSVANQFGGRFRTDAWADMGLDCKIIVVTDYGL